MVEDTLEGICPFCKEQVNREATRCWHCRSYLRSPLEVSPKPIGGGQRLRDIDWDCVESCAIEHLGDPDAFWRCARSCGLGAGAIYALIQIADRSVLTRARGQSTRITDWGCVESCAIEHLGDPDAFWACVQGCGLSGGGVYALIQVAERSLLARG
jgi:hypothetical protein